MLDNGIAPCGQTLSPGDGNSMNSTTHSLQPFVHQVGGHSNMFTYEGDTICKPLFEKEYEFYRSMPEELRPFAPICKGEFDVMFSRDNDQQVRMSIVSPVRPLPREGGVDNHSPQGPVGHQERMSTVISKSNFEKNPWSERCHKRMLDNMKSPSDEAPRRYIILGNAVINFRIPSILDLKMGTRQHGLDDNEFKTDLKIGRCLSSTSCTHGFRVSGMQVHQQTGEYYRCNKYALAAINRDTIHESFHRFLFNGVRLRLELVDPIVERLQAILMIVAKRTDIRLFSSSLMIVYEGDDQGVSDVSEDEGQAGCEVERQKASEPETIPEADCAPKPNSNSASPVEVTIKLIDFAQSFHTSSRKDREFVGPDVGYIFGLQNVIKQFLGIKQRYSAS